MPNWCDTRINFFGSDAEKLHKNICDWCYEEDASPGFEKYWLSNIAEKALGYNVDKDTNAPNCSGYIYFISEYNDEHFYVETYTAWQPCLRVFSEVVEKFNYDIEITYAAEEPGAVLYCSNDPVFNKTWRIMCVLSLWIFSRKSFLRA